MNITSNRELADAVNAAIEESGYKKSWIAEKMGLSKQSFTQFMGKKNFTIEDASKVLNIIGYFIKIEVNKKT